MDWAGIVIGIIGLIYAFLSLRSSKILEKKIVREKELIRDKVLDILQIWEGYRQRILNDRRTFNDDARNQLDIQIRIEDIEGHITVLKRFAERLEKLS